MSTITPIPQYHTVLSALPDLDDPLNQRVALSPRQQEIQTFSNDLLFLFAAYQAAKRDELTEELAVLLRDKYHLKDSPEHRLPFPHLPKEEWKKRVQDACEHLQHLQEQKSNYSIVFKREELAAFLTADAQGSLAALPMETISNLIASAIQADDISILIRLYEIGVPCAHARITGLFSKKCSPLFFALHASKENSFQCLLLIGAPVTQREEQDRPNSSPIHFALHLHEWDKLQVMLQQLGKNFNGGITPERKEEENKLLLNLCIGETEEAKKILKLLLQNPRYTLNEVRPGHTTPLTFACLSQCDKAIIKLFVEAGADPFQADGKGRTPLQEIRPESDVCRYLLQRRMTLQTQEISEAFLASLSTEHIPIERNPPSHRITIILKKKIRQGAYKKIFATEAESAVFAKFPRCIVIEDEDKIRKEVVLAHQIAALTPYVLESFLVEYDGKRGRKLGLLMNRYPGNLCDQMSKMSPEAIFSIAIELVSALSVMHAFGFIHGDLKSDNILVREQSDKIWTIKLCDFGSTRREGEPARHLQTFPPPEVFEADFMRKNLTISPAIDLWALSDLLFSLLVSRSHRSLFVEKEAWYDPIKKPGSERLFISRAKETSQYLKERAYQTPSPLLTIIAQLASINPLERPPALHVLACLRDMAASLGYHIAVQKVDSELHRIEELLPKISDEKTRQNEVTKLAFVYSYTNHEKSLQLALDIQNPFLRDMQLHRIIDECLQKDSPECAVRAASYLRDSNKKTDKLVNILRHYLLVADCENAYSIIDFLPSREDQDEAFRSIFEEVMGQKSPDILIAHLVQELCERSFLENAEFIIKIMSNTLYKAQAMTVLIKKMMNTHEIERAISYVLAIEDPTIQMQSISIVVEQLCIEKKFQQALDLASRIPMEELRTRALQDIEQKKASTA